MTGIFLVEFGEHFEVSTTYVSFIGAVEIGSVAILGKLVFVHIKNITVSIQDIHFNFYLNCIYICFKYKYVKLINF